MKLILFFICLITFLFMGESMAQQNINKLSTKELTVNGKMEVNSTTLSSKPCPAMTETQRNAIASPLSGSCVYNTSTLQLNVYNGTIWKSAGGGISNWETSFNYAVGDVVIESNKIYQCNTAHTSTVFASQIANWTQIANNVSDATGVLPLANGGTNKNATASAGAVVYSDADSFELSSVGTSGQVLQSNGASAPSFVTPFISTKSENGSSVSTTEIQAPNNQITTTDTGKRLFETGNFNLIENPGFEHSTYLTAWTTTGTTATISAETSSLISGKKAFKAVSSTQNISLVQDSTLYAAQLAGMQGYIQMSCSNTAPNVQLCARGAGATSTTNCVTLDITGAWKQYEIPVVLSATSNGISLAATSTTGTTICDEAYVGLISGKTPEVSQARLAGESYWVGNNNCTPTRTNTAYGVFTDDADCTGPTIITSSVGAWATTDANNIEQTITNIPAGTYVVEFQLPYTTSASLGGLKIFDGNSTCQPESIASALSLGNGIGVTVRCSFTYTSLQASRTFELYGFSNSGNIIIYSLVNAQASFKLFYYPPASKIYSQQCTNNPTACENEFSALVTDGSGTTTVSNENLDFINGNCTNPGAGQYVCTFNSGIFTVPPNCVITPVGSQIVPYSSTTASALTATFRNDSGTLTDTSFQFICQKQGADFKAQNVITGTFAEMMRVLNVSKPKTCNITFGGAGSLGSPTVCSSSPCVEYYDNCSAVSSAPTRSATGQYNFSFADGTWANSTFLDCKASSRTAGAGSLVRLFWPPQTTSSGGASISPNTVIGATDTDSIVSITCFGQAP
jgi:hypothetical protein